MKMSLQNIVQDMHKHREQQQFTFLHKQFKKVSRQNSMKQSKSLNKTISQKLQDDQFELNESKIISANPMPKSQKIQVKPKEWLANKDNKENIQQQTEFTYQSENIRSNSFITNYTEPEYQQMNKQYKVQKKSFKNSLIDSLNQVFKFESKKEEEQSKKWIQKRYSIKDIPYLKKTYSMLKTIPKDKKIQQQIQKDAIRTYSYWSFFQQKQKIQALENVLTTYSNYEPQIGYIQGLNFIAGALLYNAQEEYLAFWLMVNIIETMELRDILINEMCGLKKHTQLLNYLLYLYIPDLYNHFTKIQLDLQLCLQQWLYCLLGTLLSPCQFSMFYDQLFSDGWYFFYKVVLSIFSEQKDRFLQLDQIDILVELTKKQEKNNQMKWKWIFGYIKNFEFPKGLITIILDTFDVDTQKFNEKKVVDQQSQQILGGFIRFLDKIQ